MKMGRRKVLLLIVILLGFSTLPALAQPTPSVVGAWDIQIVPSAGATSRGVVTFHANGTVDFSGAPEDTTGTLTRGDIHGVWRQVGANPDTFEFVAALYSYSAGVAAYRTEYRGTIEVNGNTLQSPAPWSITITTTDLATGTTLPLIAGTITQAVSTRIVF